MKNISGSLGPMGFQLLAGLLIWGISLVMAPSVTQASSNAYASDGFTASFPTPPTRSVQFNKSPVGKIKAHRYVAQDASGHYTIEVSQLPGIAVAFGSRKTIYRKAEKAFLKKTQVAKVASQRLEIQGIPANRLQFKASMGQQGEAWFLLVGKKLYVLVGKSQVGLSEVQSFLNSFRLTNLKA